VVLLLSAVCATLTVALVTAAPARPPASPSRPRFLHVTTANGLAHKWVQAIHRDSRGFVWFGTQDGLNRFDGVSLKTYRYDAADEYSLPSSTVRAITEDGSKRLWVLSGWGRKGLALYDRDRDRFERFLPNPAGTVGNDVRSLIEDRQGRLWLATDAGAVLFDPEARSYKVFALPIEEGSTPPFATKVLEDRHGRLWVGTGVGLFQLARDGGRYSRYGSAPSASGNREVTDLLEDETGALWVAYENGGGLARVDPETGSERLFLPREGDRGSLSDASLHCLAAAGEGRIYVGTQNGLNVLELRTGRFTRMLPDLEDRRSLSSASIWALHEDVQGVLWVGTFNGGVDVLSTRGNQFGYLRAGHGGLSDPHVAAVLEDDQNRIWVGTDGGGLNKVDRANGQISYYRHDPKDPTTIGSDAVLTLCQDRRRRLWIGGWDAGIGLLDPASGKVTRFRHREGDPASLGNDSVFMIQELRSGELLLATQGGTDIFDPDRRRFSRLSERCPGAGLDHQFVAIEGRDGDLWLGGQIDAEHIDLKNRVVTTYAYEPANDRSLPPGWVLAIHEDSRGNVWIGTEGGLLSLAAGSLAPRRYTTADGLPHDSVTNILEDASGALWLSTNRGLAKMLDAVSRPERPRFLYFDADDGLEGIEFTRGAAFRSASGEVFLGGSHGLNSFMPDAIRQNPTPPPIVFTGLKVLGHAVRPALPGSPLATSISETETLTLPYTANVMTLEFAALNFIVPTKNRYRYRLEGFDREWSPISADRTATYTNLAPGRYVFRVRAANNDGVWNESGAALRIVITPPFWQTWWFRALGLLAIAAGLAAAHRTRVAQLRQRERELKARVEEELARVKILRGLLPICACCKKVRDDHGYWSQIESYIADHSEADFSHGLCPDCVKEYYPEYADAVLTKRPR
jgi:ligand-binding sensor domain-containing protein